jgi:hypothetical protein
MAGGGEVIPNGSIHWNVTHDNQGKPHKWTNVKNKPQGQHKDDVCQDNAVLYGVDSIGVNQFLHVTLRFRTPEEATNALQGAVVKPHGPSGMSQIEFYIEAVNRSALEAAQPPPNPYAQIKYEWGVSGGTVPRSSLASPQSAPRTTPRPSDSGA